MAAQRRAEEYELGCRIRDRNIAGFYSEKAPPGSLSHRLLYLSRVRGTSRKIRDFSRS